MPQKVVNLVAIVLLAISLALICYGIDRSNFGFLLGLYGIGFTGFWLLIKKTTYSVKHLILIGIVARLILLFATPNLSDDYFRFAFDGDMIKSGENPFIILPEDYSQLDSYQSELVGKMNSPRFYTVYPPINQICFSIPSYLAGDNIWLYTFWLRILIVLFEILTAMLMLKLLNYFDKNIRLVALYFLNPLVIIELTGNLHFEGVTMFFFLLAIWLLIQKEWWKSSIVYALAIGTKLIPLMFLPFLIKRMKARAIMYFLLVAVGVVILFIPFINNQLMESFANVKSSVDLYFEKFMFNGSIFNIIDWAFGYYWGIKYSIGIVGKYLAAIVFFIVVFMSVTEKKMGYDNLIKNALLALFVYYLMASIVHPWYVVNLVVLCLFTEFRFPILWSFTAIFSYYAYHQSPIGDWNGKDESDLLIAVEYVTVFVLFIYEWRSINKGRDNVAKNILI